MSEENQNVHYEKDGDVVIFRREDGRSKAYYARIKVPKINKWKKFSLRTSEMDDAVKLALEKFKELEILASHNIQIYSRKFRQSAELAMEDMQDLIAKGAGRPSYIDYIRAIPKFVEFFGNKEITSITRGDIADFYYKRGQVIGRKLNRSTVNTYNAALNRVFDIAVGKGWLSERQIPQFKVDAEKPGRRPVFEPHEIEHLIKFLGRYTLLKTTDSPQGGVKERTLWIRWFLRNYCHFILYTGMRPGTELKGLRWKNFHRFEKDGVGYFKINLSSGKTGARTVVAPAAILSDVLILQGSLNPKLENMQLDQLLEQDDFIFRLPDGEWPKDLPGAFERALTRSKLLLDGAGDKRSLYSLRHTYATNALVSGQASIHEIALNMGTSVYMIERHYSHLKVVQKARELSAGTRDMYASTSFGDVYSKAVEEESVRTERRAKMRRDEASRKEKFKEFEANIDKYLNGDSEEEKK